LHANRISMRVCSSRLRFACMMQSTLHYAWTCSCCGRQFDELPIHWAATAPLQYEMLSVAERSSRAELSDDFCTIDGSAFFIRGNVALPLVGYSETFTWGAWVSLSAASMEGVRAAWNRHDRQRVGPFFGWLCTALPYEPTMVGIKARVHFNAPPILPFIELEATDHPLAIEQRQGISVEQAIAIVERLPCN
jgi:hypothetical protein